MTLHKNNINLFELHIHRCLSNNLKNVFQLIIIGSRNNSHLCLISSEVLFYFVSKEHAWFVSKDGDTKMPSQEVSMYQLCNEH